ncbi:MAG: hypothetical protein H0X46_05755, partial [Bacteroidetes bacterium]|nr:hypothetical protein [Bacteroidota bacterium]
MLKTKRFWKRVVIAAVLLPTLLFSLLVGIVYWQQDAITQTLLSTLNKDFQGKIELDDSHISPFENFPYISIDLENVKIYEDKSKSNIPLLSINDAYLSFDIWTLLNQKFEIKSVKLKGGHIDLIQYKDGGFNIEKAFASIKKIEDPGQEFHMDIKSIFLTDIDITKFNEENNIKLEAFINNAESKFKTSDEHLMVGFESKLLLNIIKDGDTTFFKHKHFKLHTKLDFDKKKHVLTIQPSEIEMENGVFGIDGSIDVDDDVNLDLRIHGNKPNFDLFIAFAPEEIIPALKKYDQSGKIFFEAKLKGKTSNGRQPAIEAWFGCENAFFKNMESEKKLGQMYFKGHFTNGAKRNLSTMEFSLEDFSAKPEAGTFTGYLKVKNFESPEIETRIKSDFDLDFLSKFLNLKDFTNLKGSVAFTMNFHDVIDLTNPENSIEKLNESYFTELLVTNLSFESPYFHLPVHDLDIKASMDGHEAKIAYFKAKVGESDISISGSVSDLPAILHHTSLPVTASLLINSGFLDIHELTNTKKEGAKIIDEQVEKLSMKFSFKSSAKAFTESPTLPIGEFFIDNLYAKFKHYPHTLHDFHADMFIEDHDFRVVDFTGVVDKSDFHIAGKLKNYNLWFEEHPKGDTKIEFSINSSLLQLEDLFAYKGENYVPEDYRHEEFKNLHFSGYADLHFKDSLYSSDVYINNLTSQMKIHPLKLENFNGRIHYENEHLLVENFSAQLGNSKLLATLQNYT